MTSYSESSARQRIDGLVDPGTFREFLPPPKKVVSPHLGAFNLPVAFDDGIVVGEASMGKIPVLIASQEGRFMGGSVGEIHGAKLVGLLRLGLELKHAGIVLLLDTGGVRLHEASAGLIAVGEVQRAVFDLRMAGISVLAAIGSRNGCFGGMAIIARSCDWIIMSEEGRLSVSGPEVIETIGGVEELDARDRPLVWRTMGGKHRCLLHEADTMVADSLLAFRSTILKAIGRSRPITLSSLRSEQASLQERIDRFSHCADALEIWKGLGVVEPTQVPNLDLEQFNDVLHSIR